MGDYAFCVEFLELDESAEAETKGRQDSLDKVPVLLVADSEFAEKRWVVQEARDVYLL
jgi:hypothetical protein